MNDLEQNVRDIEGDLKLLADSDLPCSWIAQQLIDSYGMETTTEDKQSTQEPITADREQNNEPKGSVFAY